MTWQMCAEQCAAPETKNFSVTLKRGDGQTAPDAAELTGNMAGLAAPDWAEGLKARISQEGKNRHPAPQDKRTPRSAGFRLFFLQSGGNQPYHSPNLQKTG